MASLEKPCFLLPHGSERSNVYVCIPVDPGLAERSPVIETLMEFEGLVEMPEGISFDDFEAWAAIATQDPSKLALEELSLGLQVSDKLSAHNSTQLAAAFAAKLKATDWRVAASKEAAMHALLRLEKNVQHLVFREAGNLSAPTIFSWPMLLQQAYSDLWAIPSRYRTTCAFTISEGHSPASVLRFLDLLSRTDPGLPGLSSLSLPCAIPTAEAANRLCSVLLHHSKLEAIYMPRLSCEACGPFPPAATVFRTLPQLTGITSLTLSAPCLPATPTDAVTEAEVEAVQAMAAAISTLPRLSHFHLSSTPSAPPPHSATNGRSSRRSTASGTSPAPKRRKIAACMRQGGGAATPPSLDPVIAALSTAPSLTALNFTLPSAALGCPFPCSGIHGQFCTLQQLTYESTDRVDRGGAEGPPPGMEVLDTSGVRLAGLTRLDYANASSHHGEDCGSLRRMLAAAALHPALKEVEIRLGKPFSENTTSGFELDVYFPTALEDVTVCVERGMTEAVAQVLQSGLRSLADSAYRMTLELHSRFSERQLEGVQHVATALPPLATFTALQELDICVDVQPTDINDQTKALCHAILAQPLQPLRLLTSLCIHMPAQACVPLSLVAKQLQEMGQLQTLAIGGFEHGGSPDLRSCVAPLTALDYLHVNVRPVTADFVRAWANTVAAMPQIVQSNLCSCDVPVLNPAADNESYADVDWFRGLLDLPSRGRYDIQCHNGETPKGELEAVRQQLVDRGARVSGFPGHISFENDC